MKAPNLKGSISIRSRSDLDPFEASNHRWQETPVELRHWAPKGKKDGDGFPDVWMKPLAMERSTMFKFGKNGNLGWFMALFYPLGDSFPITMENHHVYYR